MPRCYGDGHYRKPYGREVECACEDMQWACSVVTCTVAMADASSCVSWHWGFLDKLVWEKGRGTWRPCLVVPPCLSASQTGLLLMGFQEWNTFSGEMELRRIIHKPPESGTKPAKASFSQKEKSKPGEGSCLETVPTATAPELGLATSWQSREGAIHKRHQQAVRSSSTQLCLRGSRVGTGPGRAAAGSLGSCMCLYN